MAIEGPIHTWFHGAMGTKSRRLAESTDLVFMKEGHDT
jgi:hypothetical protein